MFENFTTPEEVFSFKLGEVLTAERDVLGLIQAQIEAANHSELKDLLTRHYTETEHQVSNIEQCFTLLGEQADTSPSPVSKGIAKESAASLKKTDSAIVDSVIIAGTLKTEYVEQADYEILIANADARGAQEVKALLEENLQQEIAMGKAIKDLGWRLAHQGYEVNAASGQENAQTTESINLTGDKADATSATGTSDSIRITPETSGTTRIS